MNDTISTERPTLFDISFDRLLHLGPRRRHAMRAVSTRYKGICTDCLVDLFDLLVEDCAKTLEAIGWPIVESGFLLFAQWKVDAGCESVFRVLNIPADRCDELLGHILEKLGRNVLANIFQRKPSLLLTVIANPAASDEARAFSLRALPVLVAQGYITRHEVIPVIKALFTHEDVCRKAVILAALFDTCSELHPSDFIIFLLTASELPSAPGRRAENAVLKALNRPIDSLLLENDDHLEPFSAANWIKPKGSRSRQRTVFASLEVPNPDWEYAFRQGMRIPEDTRFAVRKMLAQASRDLNAHTRWLTPFPLVCSLCLAVELDDIESGRHLLRILRECYGIISALLLSDVRTLIPYVLVRLFSSTPEELARLANSSSTHIEGRKAAVVAIARLIHTGFVEEALGRSLFESLIYWIITPETAKTELGTLVLWECAKLKCMKDSPYFSEALFTRRSSVPPAISADKLQLKHEEINAVNLMRLSRVHTGSPGSSPRLQKYTELRGALLHSRQSANSAPKANTQIT